MALNQRLPEYDVLRRRAQKDARLAGQEQVGALQRRLASQGMLGSGAALKQEGLARQEAQKMGQEASQTIDFAEAQERQRRTELEQAKQFQTSEREASQQYATGERLGSQEYATGERMGAEDFQAKQAEIQRGFSKGMFDEEMNFKKLQETHQEYWKEADNAYREKEFAFNARVARNTQLMNLAEQFGFDNDEMNKILEAYGWLGM